MSPPSRAAWIEIGVVALLKLRRQGRRLHGRRGLKSFAILILPISVLSPPSRAAWIEITIYLNITRGVVVAAFTGGVD